MKHLLLLCCAMQLAIWLGSCNIINPKEATPYFLQIDSANLAPTDLLVHGDVSKKITDIWVYQNNKLLGTYEIPAKVPILPEGGNNIDVLAGVFRNGISTNRIAYPFYEFKNIPITWAPGTITHYTPTFTYVAKEQMKMYVHENFEIGNSFTPTNADTPVIRTTAAKYGNYCGHIVVDEGHQISNNVIAEKISIPNNIPYYIELDYKCDIPFDVSLLCISASGIITQNVVGSVNIKQNWNKIYLDAGALASAVKNKYYSVVISVTKPLNNSVGNVWIDNVKLIGPQ